MSPRPRRRPAVESAAGRAPAARRARPRSGRTTQQGTGGTPAEIDALLARIDRLLTGKGKDPANPEVRALRERLAALLRDADRVEDPEHEERWRGPPEVEDTREDGDEEDLDRDEGRAWYPPSRPLPVAGGLTARTKRGQIGESWWSRRFLAAVETVLVGGRSGRGRTYARKGQVRELTVGAGMIAATVQGSRPAPYRVEVAMPVVADEQWERVVEALSAEAGFSARLLAGELPREIEEVFGSVNVALLPSPITGLSTACSCPDWANPCKHIAAVCYLVAERFDEDPFSLLAWRGREKHVLLAQLRVLRGVAVAERAPTAPGKGCGAAPPLTDCLRGFYKAGPQLADVRLAPEPTSDPGAVLRQCPRGLLRRGNRDLAEMLVPVYEELARAAAARARGGDPPR